MKLVQCTNPITLKTKIALTTNNIVRDIQQCFDEFDEILCPDHGKITCCFWFLKQANSSLDLKCRNRFLTSSSALSTVGLGIKSMPVCLQTISSDAAVSFHSLFNRTSIFPFNRKCLSSVDTPLPTTTTTTPGLCNNFFHLSSLL